MKDETKNQIKEIKEMIQVVLLAIPREISARKFYLNAAQKATGDKSREMFIQLAEQEKEHETKLRNILETLKTELKQVKQS